jgi:hypothetical protein
MPSETLVYSDTARRYIPEGSHLQEEHGEEMLNSVYKLSLSYMPYIYDMRADGFTSPLNEIML